ncbi:hypothetical protein AB0C34_29030 [Nocardia sp. NPDC049220]|uniref:hypothetical protein n=1 Tax=Nocardia sp. NPDC049220 TaxID=3155273 RepID=UPI0033DC17B2
MRVADSRCGAVEFALRVNTAVGLLEAGAEAARVLAAEFDCSSRQARRYVERAASGGRVVVPEEMVVFTVKVPAALAVRVRERAKESGGTISALVTAALIGFLARGHTQPRRR